MTAERPTDPNQPTDKGQPEPAENALPDVAPETGETGNQILPRPVSPVLSSPTEAPPLYLSIEKDFADDVYTPAPAANPVVSALKANGLYIEDAGDGFHRVTCPWASEHPSEVQAQAGYLEPCFGHPIGLFRCTHNHSEKRDAESLIDHLGITPEVARAKAVIYMQTGETHRAAAASERVLAADGSYFDARGPIVRIIKPSPNDISTELVNDQTVSAFLASKIDYYRKAKSNQWERCDPPASIIQSLRYNQDRHHLQPLTGLSRQPFYGADGILVSKAGYDEATGTYAGFDEADYNLVNPTREDAERELTYIKWLLREFQFATKADQAAALAAILTAAVRASLPLAPAININAPRSGGGKSFLAALIALAAAAGEPYNTSYPTTPEEAAKVLLAMLLEKPAVVLFDDMQVQTGWKSLGPMNKALTSTSITERVLSRSRTATARTNVLFMGTGNNVEPGQDMRRRVLSIRLAPRSETPTLQQYSFNPVAHVRKRRSHIVQAALTIIEAHRLAGRPVSDVPSIGSFEEWSLTCRQPLLWLGEPDPATSLIQQVQDDSDQDTLGEFLQHWSRLFRDDPMMVREVVPYAARDARFADVLEEIGVMDGSTVNTKRLGWYLKLNRSRWANSLRIESGPNSQRNTWRVIAD
ncbi:hypothetical protein [Brevundimonas sp. 374]|uniref:hypothetical protein n=1 Tax=Brevundimonas sp. 374 TaxID=1150400 RepID=UPI00088E0116|nr:hypothetical protein [Brevundimonas sp. 374]SDQ79813.1 hypothetical protein SAMN02787020_1998 [Brevundimonas sp. 374]